jgi:BASS family bile acid:Na+ symporter
VLNALVWLGRQRGWALAALVIFGICLPPLGAALRPYVGVTVFLLLSLAFLRMDSAALGEVRWKPGAALTATAWSTFILPFIAIGGAMAVGFDDVHPILFAAIALQALTCPMMAAPALAGMMGLRVALVLVALVLASLLTPLSAPAFAAFAGLDLALSPWSLGLMLGGMLAGSAVLGLICRRGLGAGRVADNRLALDGVNIVLLFVFVSAVMGDVGLALIAAPRDVLLLMALGFAVNMLFLALTWLVFLPFGRSDALAIALMTSQRNMG